MARRTANFAGPKTRKKLNSPAWKIYSPADEILLLTYFHGVIQGDRISTFLNCLVGKFQKIACGAILRQHLGYRPFHKLRHEQHLPRFRNNALTTNSQRIFLDMYSFHKSMIRGIKGDNHLGNCFKTRQVLFVT